MEIERNWVRCDDALPILGDYSVLAHFENGSIETVHVEDHFRDITAGLDDDGNQLYTKWYLHNNPAVTHWMYLPDHPNNK